MKPSKVEISKQGLNWQAAIILFLKGFFMGAADVIPGVSGGTIALIVGIYEELIDTISRYDGQMLTLLWQRKWKALFQRMNLSFLMPLGLGILMAIFSLAKLMTYLLSYHESLTYAVFFGLILGSVFLMARDFQKNLINLGLLIFGAVFTFGLVGLLPMETPKTLIAFFTSALIAICAMILPGISGSFILLLLGKYKQVMEVVKSPFAGDHIWFVLVFALGALIGIIGFSKLLKWLLRHYHNALFAFLIGMMLGSLRKLWPFTGIDFSIGSIAGRIFLMLIGLAAVYLIYRAENYRTAK